MKHDKIKLLARNRLNTIEVLISRSLIDSYMSNDEFHLVNNALTEYGNRKEAIKNLKTSTVHQIF